MRNVAVALRAGAVVLSCLIVAALTPPASPQSPPWAQKIFMGVTSHDFGTVPHGAQLKHRLVLKNIYTVPLEITEIRATCGCLTFKESARTLQPKQEAYIDLTMDASRFNGPKSVQLLVTVGPTYVSTAVINVTAVARDDVVFTPGDIDFGTVPAGVAPVKWVDVEYNGPMKWQIEEIVKSKSAPFTVTAQEILRHQPGLLKTGKVIYRLQVTMNTDAPPGLFRQELLLKTNDPASPTFTVYVEGNVQAGLSVSHEKLDFGIVPVGTKATLNLIIKGSQPFKVTSIENTGAGIQADVPPGDAQANHIITIHCAPTQSGEINRKLVVHTDFGKGATVAVQVQANHGS